jgi:hypothetical protein
VLIIKKKELTMGGHNVVSQGENEMSKFLAKKL